MESTMTHQSLHMNKIILGYYTKTVETELFALGHHREMMTR